MAKPIVSQERLREILDYDPETGVFVWRVMLAHRASAGTVAGGRATRGYLMIGIGGIHYFAHRLAWTYMYGDFLDPKVSIDHIDGNPLNNRIANLRACSQGENMQNRYRPQKNNKSGYLGVCWSKQKQRYLAQIKPTGQKTRSLGFFDTPEAAHEAYLAAKRALHPFGVI